MAKLGKSLVFYFKYPAEMDRLYWQPRQTGEEPNADGLKEKEEVLAMIRRVGDAACRDVATFLEACTLQIEPHLQSIGIATRCRNTLERRWEIRWGLSSKRAPERKFEVGVYIDEQIRAIVPWVWCRGGLRAENEVVKILGRGLGSRTLNNHTSSGTVLLSPVDVTIPIGPQDFEVDQDPLVQKVCEALTITAADVKAIAAILRNGD